MFASKFLLSTLLIALIQLPLIAQAITEEEVRVGVLKGEVEPLKKMGPAIVPIMVSWYLKEPSEETRAQIAQMFYGLGWKSPEAKQALMKDVKTKNQRLRLQAQWALGRVSGDDDVVDVLLDNMRNDDNPLFRDKAACALAYDQIHLNSKQKYRLYVRLVAAMKSNNPQVRDIASRALQINTGQPDVKGYQPNGSEADRQVALAKWDEWLAKYEKNLP